MRVALSNWLDDCPSDCGFRDIETDLVYVKNIAEDSPQIIVIVTCKHMDVCKLRGEDE